MMSSSNDLENLEKEETLNNMLLENDSPNKLFNCKSSTITTICFLLTIIIIVAITVVFFTTLY
jgi:hypothetical protein